jgi:hypothetical protein
MKTLMERFEAALTARGELFVKTTTHYRVLSRTKAGFYFLGVNGALRYGSNVSTCRPVSDEFKAKLLAEADAIPKGPTISDL